MVSIDAPFWTTVAGEGIAVSVSFQSTAIEFYLDLAPSYRAAVTIGAVVIVGFLALGILPGYSTRVVRTARRSPIISILIGVPGTVVLLAFLYLAHLISDSSLGVFFAIPLVSVGLTLLPVWIVLGLITVGGTVGTRLGVDHQAVWLLVGSIVVSLAALSIPALATVTAVAAFVGVGAGTRVLVGTGVSRGPDERPIPPANKI